MGSSEWQAAHDRLLALEVAVLIYEAEQRRKAQEVEPAPRRLLLPELTPRLKSFGVAGVLFAGHFSVIGLLLGPFS